jgi:hypothetical protein
MISGLGDGIVYAGLKAEDLPIPKRRAARLSPVPKD